ncbi:hypothetical protein MASR2M117_14610 [Paludibacter sp.]
MKNKLILSIFLWTFVAGSVSSQCNFERDGTFERPGNGAAAGWTYLHDNNAEYSLQGEEVHSGTGALKIWAKETHDWNIRMYQGCNLPLVKAWTYTVVLWMKGEVGTSFGVALQSNDAAPLTFIEENTTIENTEWNQYTYVLKSDGNYTKGKVKITFKKAGIYYLDDVSVKENEPEALPEDSGEPKEWQLVWEQNFDKVGIADDPVSFDPESWTKSTRGSSDWNAHMTSHSTCYDFRDGNMVLRGIKNENVDPNDPSQYLTGGYTTKGKKNFGFGRIEIRAKLQAGQGAWPAIWMMPNTTLPWPQGGEVDIMERINYEARVHQTVHTHYTKNLGNTTNPKQSNQFYNLTLPNTYNTYAVERYQDSLVFYVNYTRTHIYPRVKELDESLKQFPFADYDFYLILSMQLGGNWAGAISDVDLPNEMHIDWVRFYELKEKVPTELPILKGNEKEVWSIYPNPAKDKIQVVIDSESKERELLFFNTMGQLVYKTTLTSNKQEVDVTPLKSKGVIFATLGRQDMRNAVKLVVND